MSEQAPPPASPASTIAGSTAPQPRARSGCLGRAIGGLLLVIFSVALAVAAVGALAFYVFGYTPELPTQAARAQSDLTEAQTALQGLRQQNDALRTQVAGLETQSGSSRELLQDLNRQVRDLSGLTDDMRRYDGIAATVQADSRDSRTAVAAYATAMATRIAQIDQLQRNTDRIGRFLQRLSDISGDTVNDLGGTAVTPASSAPSPSTPTGAPTASPVSTPSLTPAPPSATRTPVEPTVPLTATTPALTGTVAPAPTSVGTATTATRSPTAKP